VLSALLLFFHKKEVTGSAKLQLKELGSALKTLLLEHADSSSGSTSVQSFSFVFQASILLLLFF